MSESEFGRVIPIIKADRNRNVGNGNGKAEAAQWQRGDEESVDIFSDSSMVQWKDNLVPEKEAKGLRHVFYDLQDHFGHQRPDPMIRFNASLAHPGQGQTWFGDLDFTYDINGDQCKIFLRRYGCLCRPHSQART